MYLQMSDGSDFIVDLDENIDNETFTVFYADGSRQIKPIGWLEIFRSKMEEQFTSELILRTEENMIRKSILGFCTSAVLSLGSLIGIIYAYNLSMNINNKLIILGAILVLNIARWLRYLNNLANYGQVFCMMQCVEYFKEHRDSFLFNYLKDGGKNKEQIRAINIEDIYQGQYVVNDLKIIEQLIGTSTDEDLTRLIDEKLEEKVKIKKKSTH